MQGTTKEHVEGNIGERNVKVEDYLNRNNRKRPIIARCGWLLATVYVRQFNSNCPTLVFVFCVFFIVRICRIIMSTVGWT